MPTALTRKCSGHPNCPISCDVNQAKCISNDRWLLEQLQIGELYRNTKDLLKAGLQRIQRNFDGRANAAALRHHP